MVGKAFSDEEHTKVGRRTCQAYSATLSPKLPTKDAAWKFSQHCIHPHFFWYKHSGILVETTRYIPGPRSPGGN